MSVRIEILLTGSVEVVLAAIGNDDQDIHIKNLGTLPAVIEYFASGEAEQAAIVVIDYRATQELDGDEGGRSRLLERIKHSKGNFGSPLVIGVSGVSTFENKLKAMGCDITCKPTELEGAMRVTLARLRGA